MRMTYMDFAPILLSISSLTRHAAPQDIFRIGYTTFSANLKIKKTVGYRIDRQNYGIRIKNAIIVPHILFYSGTIDFVKMKTGGARLRHPHLL
jgi:hypothetical protein